MPSARIALDRTPQVMALDVIGDWRDADLGLRGGDVDLRAEVAWCLELERLARHRWRRDMAALEPAGHGSSGGR